MPTDNLVLIEQFCVHHNIEGDFISSLQEFGLIELVIIEEHKYIPYEQLKETERMVRLHYDLGINLEGLDAIAHLQQRMNELQAELNYAKNRLRLFE